MLTGSLRANNAIEPFHNAFAGSIAQADRPTVARFLEPIHLQQNMSCAAILIPTHETPTDREIAEIEAVRKNDIDRRQEERNSILAALEVRYGEDGDAQKLVRGVSRNYMWRYGWRRGVPFV